MNEPQSSNAADRDEVFPPVESPPINANPALANELAQQLNETVSETPTRIQDVPSLLCCPQCNAVRELNQDYCGECGFIYASAQVRPTEPISVELVGGRYRLQQLLRVRGGLSRYLGVDVGTPDHPIPVLILKQEIAPTAKPVEDQTDEIPLDQSTLEFDLPEVVQDQITEELINFQPEQAEWPSVFWEQKILVKAVHLSLPRLIDAFTENGFSYLIEEAPVGKSLWESWDSESSNWSDRCTWLIQIAEALDHLHQAGAICEVLRPDMFIISPSGQAILKDLGDLLPSKMEYEIPITDGFSTAPELVLTPLQADGRADLYSFGALLYALLMERELTELDFSLSGHPRSYIERCPDVNPFLARILCKTFVRELEDRFPTNDGKETDPTGFRELIEALQACRRNLDQAHLDIASWSNTGMIRSGNEDAVAIIHGSESRLEDRDDFACIILADGMGGMEAGEVAAAMTVQSVRQRILNAPPFIGLQTQGTNIVRDSSFIPTGQTRGSIFDHALDNNKEIAALKTLIIQPKQAAAESLMVRTEDRQSASRQSSNHTERMIELIKAVNKQVHDASRYGFGGRGMGCTLEVVLIDGPQCIIGHVGDSRVYHMHHGRLKMVTHDHTLVSRLVELGHITEAEAETHPRRSELQQAIGGRSEVVPEMIELNLMQGDWLLACSDGLSNQLHITMMEAILRESPNAEKAARRLINMAILNGANDNVTVAVVRVS